MREKKIIGFALVMLLCVPFTPPVLADESDATASLGEETANTLDDSELAKMRGGQDQYLNDMELFAELYENQAISNVTGTNIITQDAFAGAKGFATVIQNSGNNVIIQNATILNLRLQ